MNTSMRSIILVEDDTNLRQSISLILQRAGYFVTPTDNVYSAIDFVGYGGYQLIIADSNMPGTQRVLLPNIHSNHPYVSVMVLTDNPASASENKDKYLSAHYLVKPVAPERLLDCVEMVLNKLHLHQ